MSHQQHTAERAKFVFGCEMCACPKCGSYNIGYSTPIKLKGPVPEDAKGVLKAWTQAHGPNGTELEGTAKIMCRQCGHLGPAMDVTGRTGEEVRKDPAVAAQVKKLWNEQPLKIETT